MIKTFSQRYIKSKLSKNNRLEAVNIYDRLKKLEKFTEYQEIHISNIAYNKNIAILLLKIIKNLHLTDKGLFLQSRKESRNHQNIVNLYKIITYGNLEIRSCSILKDAIYYGMKRMIMEKKYGN